MIVREFAPRYSMTLPFFFVRVYSCGSWLIFLNYSWQPTFSVKISYGLTAIPTFLPSSTTNCSSSSSNILHFRTDFTAMPNVSSQTVRRLWHSNSRMIIPLESSACFIVSIMTFSLSQLTKENSCGKLP